MSGLHAPAPSRGVALVCATSIAALVLAATLSLAVGGLIPNALASLLAPLSLIACGACTAEALRAAGLGERPFYERHGFWLFALSVSLSLPGLGSFSLIDPWESHYAEVAREMLERRDFISPWWGHEGWFMSKPVLSLWLDALAMKALGAQTGSGRVLEGSLAHFARPEWAIRLPSALLMSLGCQILYRGVSAVAGRRAGFLSGVVLATSAQWTLVSRQALTDAAFVGPLAAAFGCAFIARSIPAEVALRRYALVFRGRRLQFDARVLLFSALAVLVLPQLGMLIAAGAPRAGSPGNCGLPGQPECGALSPALPWLSPALQAAFWTVWLMAFFATLRNETRARHVYWLLAWCAAGVAAMSKGLAGIALPAGVVMLHALARGRLAPMAGVSWLRGAALFVVLVAPWYVAMFARHGRVIFDELVLRHMLGRALDHLHDTNAGVDVSFRYYVGQLGHAFFPWVGLAPAALLGAGTSSRERSPELSDAYDFSLLWLTLTFALFTFMRTKFHHYILPALPPLALLAGLHLSERWSAPAALQRRRPTAALLGLCGAWLVLAVGAEHWASPPGAASGSARLFRLFTYKYDRPWPAQLDFSFLLATFSVAFAALALALGLGQRSKLAVLAQALGATVFAVWLGQSYLPSAAPHFGQRAVIEAFLRDRSGSGEPLIAYQLNWKGENFYTGNHLAIFVSSGAPLQRYLARRRAAGQHVFHFALETSRTGRLKAELGPLARFDVLTRAVSSHQFCLVRAELHRGGD